ncbi:MAG: DUF1428 domain-containing protein [Alphaproteobacteria bacterium]
MTYVDGVVLAVPTDKREDYLAHARLMADVFKENGALKLVECWGEDVPDGKVTSFPMAVKAQENETVVLSWIIWPDKETRDRGMEKVMADSRMDPETAPVPFDGKRMIFGGFDMVLEK